MKVEIEVSNATRLFIQENEEGGDSIKGRKKRKIKKRYNTYRSISNLDTCKIKLNDVRRREVYIQSKIDRLILNLNTALFEFYS